jgi:hypothetical protein
MPPIPPTSIRITDFAVTAQTALTRRLLREMRECAEVQSEENSSCIIFVSLLYSIFDIAMIPRGDGVGVGGIFIDRPTRRDIDE